MPEYLGPYGMYGILALLVVLLLLLVLISQRRKKAVKSIDSRTSAKPVAEKHTARADKKARYAELKAQADRETSAAQAGLYSPQPAGSAATLPQSPLPPMGSVPQQYSQLAPAPHVASVPIEQFMPDSDPMRSVLVDILSGWGDITQEDTNRLGVFRVDRVIGMMATAEVPRELKGNDQARIRLSQLRRWASGLEQAAKAAQPKPSAQQEYAGMGTPTAAAPGAPVEPGSLGLAATAGAAAAAVASPPAAPVQTPVAPIAPTAVSFFGTPADPGVPPAQQPDMPPVSAPTAQPTVAMAAVPPAEAPAPVQVTPAAVSAQPAAPAPGPQWEPSWEPNNLSSHWSTSSTVTAQADPVTISQQPATPSVAQQPAPAPAPTPAPAPVDVGEARKAEMADVNRSAEAAIAAAAAAFWARPEVGGTTPGAATAAPQTAPEPASPAGQPVATSPEQPAASAFSPGAQTGSVDTFMDDLRGGVTTADGLLTLAHEEQAGALAFLKPSELAKVLKADVDIELKKATIEQLQSIGSPSALDIIYHSLDNPDPQIQAKALEAADRLLGADQ